MRVAVRLGRAALVAATAVALGGCATVDYYLQSVSGHLALMAKRQPIDAVVADPATPPATRARLARVPEMLEFAESELDLPTGGSYRTYVATGRAAVTWSVVATPELSLAPRTWCFPVAGCVSYRGYYSQQAAQAYAADLAREGLDVDVAGARAYSTLGWFDDPVLDTMLGERERDLAAVVFHELAHRRLYVPDDSTFNESFAVAVEREGVRRWLRGPGRAADDGGYEIDVARRDQFLALVEETRRELEALYALPVDDDRKRAGKARAFERLRAGHARLASEWGGTSPYEGWFARPLNNARLALVATYHDRVVAFEALLREHDGDLAAFYEECESLAALDRHAREARLQRLARLATTADG